MELYGIVGAIIILMAWIPQTWKAMKSKAKGEGRLFLFMYTIGTLMLFIHSISINDLPFALLNGVMLAMMIVHLAIKLGVKI